MKKYISKFHYLTQDLPYRSHLEQAQIACANGANWVQYRCLSKSDDELVSEIGPIAEICDEWGATLIITNHYHLLDKVDAQGVHIEDLDADLIAIHRHIGNDKTLGASSTDIKRLLYVQQLGLVDYSGYGPFRHTETKPNNKPLLGFEGYRELQKQAIDIPVVAIGGVQLDDVELLLEAGVYGVAVSSAINRSDDPGGMIREIYRKIY
jgi:thiamine-phosphate pyrophosphorylase